MGVVTKVLYSCFVLCILLCIGHYLCSHHHPAANIYDWSQCRTACETECGNDTACNVAVEQYTACYEANVHCQAWDTYFENADAYDTLPESYFRCQRQCRSKGSLKWDRIWLCNYKTCARQ